MSFLNVSGICKRFGDHTILQYINFDLKQYHKIGIAGETGSGKSTLLKVIAGLLQPDEGDVYFKNERIPGPDEKLVAGHAGIAYLSQYFELPKFLRVEQVLSYANTLTSDEATVIYDVCQITHLLERKTDQLSGGEKQRIALARQLIGSPDILLLDEPFSNLDRIHKQTLQTVIDNVGSELNITCILVSHDAADTLSWANEILVMHDGEIIQQGTPEIIYKQPHNAYVAGLFGKYNLIPAKQAAAFFKSAQFKITGKQILIRPESFSITQNKTDVLKGKILDINFFGAYYEVEILINELPVIVRTQNKLTSAQDIVYLKVSKENVWSI